MNKKQNKNIQSYFNDFIIVLKQLNLINSLSLQKFLNYKVQFAIKLRIEFLLKTQKQKYFFLNPTVK